MNPNSPETNFIVKWHSSACKDFPRLRNHTSVIYKNLIVIFGGYNDEKNINNLFLYNIEKDTCSLQETSGEIPRGRNGHSATVIGNKMYMIGGWPGNNHLASDEVYILNLDNFIWEKIPDPNIGPVNMHSADLYGDQIIIFRGGNGREYLNDLISFDTKTNKARILEVWGKIPHARANHASAIVNSNLFIFGGWSGTKRLNDMYYINIEKLQWNMIEIYGHKPSPRAGMPIINYNQYLMLFGGSGNNSLYLNDLHFYNLDNNEWLSPNKVYHSDRTPVERAGHSLVLNGRFIYIFGGGRNEHSFSSMHILEVDPEPVFKPAKLKTKEKLLDGVKKYYNNPFLSDLKICNKKYDWTFFGHKFVLCLICEKFRAMFSSGCKESLNQEIYIDYDPRIFSAILKYLYSGEIDESNFQTWVLDDFLDLMKISDELLLQEVKEWSEMKIIKYIHHENFLFIYYYAKRYSADILIEYCKWYHRQNAHLDLDNISEQSLSCSYKTSESDLIK